MPLSIFDFLLRMLGYGWKLLCWVADLSLRFFSAIFDFGTRAVSAVFNLLLTPFTLGADHLWDTAGSLGVLLCWVLGLLLSACLVLGLVAAGKNVYRRFRHR